MHQFEVHFRSILYINYTFNSNIIGFEQFYWIVCFKIEI
jgi:hypothetical protein